MEYHRRLIDKVIDEEGVAGFQKEVRRDELERLSTETLEAIASIYKEDTMNRAVDIFLHEQENNEL